jgi:hypothetical protein
MYGIQSMTAQTDCCCCCSWASPTHTPPLFVPPPPSLPYPMLPLTIRYWKPDQHPPPPHTHTPPPLLIDCLAHPFYWMLVALSRCFGLPALRRRHSLTWVLLPSAHALHAGERWPIWNMRLITPLTTALVDLLLCLFSETFLSGT